mmetsp:Transcript_18020/g.37770  ORF Transcript_18020/g.37770 Transcript_18020/m.37770 type:complete len:241 (-) Transcript_18020:70-792(-)
MRQNVSAFPSHDGNGVPALIKVVFGNDPAHAEAAMNPLLFRRINYVKILLRLEKGELVEQVFTAALVAFSFRTLFSAANESIVPMGIVWADRFPLRQVGVGQPLLVGHAHHFSRLLPVGKIPFHATAIGMAVPCECIATAFESDVLFSSDLRTGVPVHEMIALGIFCPVTDISHESVHVSRCHPSLGGVLDGWIVGYHKGHFFLAVVQYLLVILFVIKDAYSLVYGKVFGYLDIVRIPVI